MALLGELQRVFENTYDRRAGVDLECCLVGPTRCAELASKAPGHVEMSRWARFFYYVENANLHLALFYDADVIETLEARDPRRTLGEANVLPFLVFAEELSHAVHTTFAFREGGPERVQAREFLDELELLARIDAYLLLRHFVVGLTGDYTDRHRSWARHHAIRRWDVPYHDREIGRRYRKAARQAARFLDYLEALPPDRQIQELRSFRALPLVVKRAARAPESGRYGPDSSSGTPGNEAVRT